MPQTILKMFSGIWSYIVENCLQKDPVVFLRKIIFCEERAHDSEKTWSHTLPHTHALLAKWHGAGWHYHCQVRKGPPRPNLSGCLQENKVFLHSLTDLKALLERNSKGATQTPVECVNSLLWQVCLKETFCWARTVETVAAQVFNKKKSVRTLHGMMNLPLSGLTFKFFQTMDQSHLFWGASVLIITPNVRPGAEEKIFQRGDWWEWPGFEGWGLFREWG